VGRADRRDRARKAAHDGGGVIVANRVNKVPLVLTFLTTYFALFTVTAFVGDPLKVAEIFRTPDIEAAMYFAFIILPDPPTSPVKYRHIVIPGDLTVACEVSDTAKAR
jgi:hypothetical protein